MKKSSNTWRERISKKPNETDLSNNPVGNRAAGLELDLRLREFEINQLTQRNNFFMIFQGVLIAGLIQSQGTAAPIITFSMSLLGISTSLLQIGMAGGAKYWQSRWEASTRSSEIALVLELLKKKKLAVQTFTHDSSLLTEDERNQIAEWNRENPNDAITDDTQLIQKIVEADINNSTRNVFRRSADWWVRRFAISPKWSVSRIPIWMGGCLLIFWVTMSANLVEISNFEPSQFAPKSIHLVPLKQEKRDLHPADPSSTTNLKKI